MSLNELPVAKLIHEVLSRARTPRPQARGPEAYRSARHVAVQARDRAARELGGR